MTQLKFSAILFLYTSKKKKIVGCCFPVCLKFCTISTNRSYRSMDILLYDSEVNDLDFVVLLCGFHRCKTQVNEIMHFTVVLSWMFSLPYERWFLHSAVFVTTMK